MIVFDYSLELNDYNFVVHTNLDLWEDIFLVQE